MPYGEKLTQEIRIKGLAIGKEIQMEQYRKRVLEYNKKPNMCAVCNNTLEYKKRQYKYCSTSCAAKRNNEIKYANIERTKCIVCEKIINKGQICCSYDCQSEHKVATQIEKIKTTGKMPKGRETQRKYLSLIKGRKCEMCGLTEWQGKPVPLVMDHINGKPSDDRLENLRFVCGNCNMQLPTFAGKNIGKEDSGRPYRMKRYYEGKVW